MLKPIPVPDAAGTAAAAFADTPVRIPPHNFEAEQALLGAILLNNRAIERVAEFLSPEHFAEPLHGRIYEASRDLIDKGKVASAITLKSWLGEDHDLKAQGGDGYLARLVGGAATIINAIDYGKLIYDLHMRRELIALGEEMVNEAFQPQTGIAAADMIADAEDRLFNLITTDKIEGGLRKPDAFIGNVVATVENTHRRKPGEVAGIPTGLLDLDKKLGGLTGPNLIILAGRPSSGKTALATTIIYSVAKRKRAEDKKYGVAMFSFEMSGEQIWQRLMAYPTELPVWTQTGGEVTAEQVENFSRYGEMARGLPIFIDDTPNLTVAQMTRRCKALLRREPLDLVVVDYIQLMGSVDSRRLTGDNRTTELSAITRGLKQMAKALEVPVIALSQLSRAVEARDDKRPIMADLRESGSIEQDADQIIMLYREYYYLQNAEPRRRPGKDDDDAGFSKKLADYDAALKASRNLCEANIAKNRQGPTGVCKLHYNDQMMMFGNLDQNHGDPDDPRWGR